jgi:NADH:ubiquinone oxidoreductase subunit F (NADH-binding)/NADH:ubiquinone oxidoreductase subunit E
MNKASGKNRRFTSSVIDEQALAEVRAVLGDMPRRRDLLIEYLHRIQDQYKCISRRHVRALAEELKLSQTEVYEVATFYHHFDVIDEDKESPPPGITVRVCESLTCEMFKSRDLIPELQARFGDAVRIQAVPCVGRCNDAPVAVVGTHPVARATVAEVEAAVKEGRLEMPSQEYIDYDQYRETGGYALLRRCVKGEYRRKAVIKLLQDANLRGLGGAGFPAGKKWEILASKPKPRLIAINIDEGEPGTFKDRYYLEQDPHRFIEGTLIASWAIESEDIYLYLRDEYAGCRRILEAELEKLRRDPPCPLPPVHLRRGAGAYICGEESAMIESIEGKRGMPRLRPPFVADVGIFGRPTLEQNMETMHWVRDIIEKGPEWFASQGRHGRKGFRSFSVSGRVNKPGVHLAPAGITIRELIDEYCGGMLPGHEFYGYFPGGASGGILPASLDDIPLDFDTLQPYGTFIGSAAIIVLSTQDSARALALNAMAFFHDESCGQCTPCRVGTEKAMDLMREEKWDTGLLEDLATAMQDASICGLGQAAPNPLRCAIKYFPEEFS